MSNSASQSMKRIGRAFHYTSLLFLSLSLYLTKPNFIKWLTCCLLPLRSHTYYVHKTYVTYRIVSKLILVALALCLDIYITLLNIYIHVNLLYYTKYKILKRYLVHLVDLFLVLDWDWVGSLRASARLCRWRAAVFCVLWAWSERGRPLLFILCDVICALKK